jgi:hypothetical protein
MSVLLRLGVVALATADTIVFLDSLGRRIVGKQR